MAVKLYVDDVVVRPDKQYGFIYKDSSKIFKVLKKTCPQDYDSLTDDLSKENGLVHLFRAGRFIGMLVWSLDNNTSLLGLYDIIKDKQECNRFYANVDYSLKERCRSIFMEIQILSPEEFNTFELVQGIDPK